MNGFFYVVNLFEFAFNAMCVMECDKRTFVQILHTFFMVSWNLDRPYINGSSGKQVE